MCGIIYKRSRKMNRENIKSMDALEKEYAGDKEALELIERSKRDIEYLERKEEESGYSGQTSKGKIAELEAILHDWY